MKFFCPPKRFVGKKMFCKNLIFYVIFAVGEDFFEWFLKLFFHQRLQFFWPKSKIDEESKKISLKFRLWAKKIEILTDKNNLQCCFICILRLKRNKLGEKRFCWNIFKLFIISEISSERFRFVWKFIGRVVDSAFYVSCSTFWEISFFWGFYRFFHQFQN